MRKRVACLLIAGLTAMLLMAVAPSVVLADDEIAPKSAGFSYSEQGLSMTYLADGENYGLAYGKAIARDGPLHLDLWGVFQPEDNQQIAVAATAGYDVTLAQLAKFVGKLFGTDVTWAEGEKVTLTPLLGFETDLTPALDGSKATQVVYGGSLTVKFN